MLWIAIALFLCAAILLLALPFYRNHDRQSRQQMLALKQNLQTIDMDEKSQDISKSEAEKQRKDTARRIIAMEEQGLVTRGPDKVDRTIFISLAAMIIIGAFGLYALLGSPQLASPAPTIAQPAPPSEFEDAIVRLVAHLDENPSDGEAWRLLAWSLTQVNRLEEAKTAYEKAIAIDPNSAEAFSGYGELLALRANGQITEQAQQALSKALELNPMDARAGYYSAIAKRQSGDNEAALNIWIKMLKNAPDDAKWRAGLLQEAKDLATEIGVPFPDDLEAKAPKGPSAEQIIAANNMSPEQQQDMIDAMINRLEQRLAQNPDDLQGWQQLIRSHMAQGNTNKAKDALAKAISAFKDDTRALAELNQLANSLQIFSHKPAAEQ